MALFALSLVTPAKAGGHPRRFRFTQCLGGKTEIQGMGPRFRGDDEISVLGSW